MTCAFAWRIVKVLTLRCPPWPRSTEGGARHDLDRFEHRSGRGAPRRAARPRPLTSDTPRRPGRPARDPRRHGSARTSRACRTARNPDTVRSVPPASIRGDRRSMRRRCTHTPNPPLIHPCTKPPTRKHEPMFQTHSPLTLQRSHDRQQTLRRQADASRLRRAVREQERHRRHPARQHADR
jgi:hypothetical protein